jgi:hypothetical protein
VINGVFPFVGNQKFVWNTDIREQFSERDKGRINIGHTYINNSYMLNYIEGIYTGAFPVLLN